MVVVGLLHPGSMGSSVGACAAASPAVSRVLWASEGRSAASRERAEADGLEDAGTLAALATEADIIVSVCPPDQASALGEQLLRPHDPAAPHHHHRPPL